MTQITRSVGGVAGPRVDFTYDNGDRRTAAERSINGAYPLVQTDFSYDAANRLTTIVHKKTTYTPPFPPVPVTAPLTTYTYGYDAANRLTTETNAEGTVTYTYDDTNQLTGAGGSRAETYTYDANGNRTMTSYTVDDGNQLSEAPGYTYTYDLEGNMSAKTETGTGKVTTFAYDYRNRLTGVTQKDSGGSVIMQATYTYDALNRRIGTQVDADGAGGGSPAQTWMVHDGDNAYADFNGSGTLVERYLHGLAIDELLARTDSGGSTDWYLPDKLGTIRDVVNTSGTIVYHAAYNSFGAKASESGGGGDRFGFTGRELDAETGNYYYRARFYDPFLGRFVEIDPIGFAADDTNLYRYVRNAPTNSVDPTGTQIPSDPGTRGRRLLPDGSTDFSEGSGSTFRPPPGPVRTPPIRPWPGRRPGRGRNGSLPTHAGHEGIDPTRSVPNPTSTTSPPPRLPSMPIPTPPPRVPEHRLPHYFNRTAPYYDPWWQGTSRP